MTEHDDKGLYGKYIILKEEGEGPKVEVYYLDGEGAIYSTRRAVAKRTPCFVLSPEKRDDYGEASRVAMQAYAMMIRPRNPQLADDIEAWLVKTYANITDDEIKEGGTLTTDPPPEYDGPKLKVEMDLSGLEKVVLESRLRESIQSILSGFQEGVSFGMRLREFESQVKRLPHVKRVVVDDEECLIAVHVESDGPDFATIEVPFNTIEDSGGKDEDDGMDVG